MKTLTDYVEIINRRAGKEPGLWSRDGLQIDAAYGGYRVVANNGSRDLSPRGTAKETYLWLDGFASALEELPQ
jgi:hypothetical protein